VSFGWNLMQGKDGMQRAQLAGQLTSPGRRPVATTGNSTIYDDGTIEPHLIQPDRVAPAPAPPVQQPPMQPIQPVQQPQPQPVQQPQPQPGNPRIQNILGQRPRTMPEYVTGPTGRPQRRFQGMQTGAIGSTPSYVDVATGGQSRTPFAQQNSRLQDIFRSPM